MSQTRRFMFTIAALLGFSVLLAPVAVVSHVFAVSNAETQEQQINRGNIDEEKVNKALERVKDKARKDVTNERKSRASIDKEDRANLCKNRKNAIENKLNAYRKNADDHLSRLNNSYDTLDTYVKEHTLTGVSLTKAAEARQAAVAAVEALDIVVGDGTVDCDVYVDNATWLTEVKNAATDARDALKKYRLELKSVVVAIHPDEAVPTSKEETTSQSSTPKTSAN